VTTVGEALVSASRKPRRSVRPTPALPILRRPSRCSPARNLYRGLHTIGKERRHILVFRSLSLVNPLITVSLLCEIRRKRSAQFGGGDSLARDSPQPPRRLALSSIPHGIRAHFRLRPALHFNGTSYAPSENDGQLPSPADPLGASSDQAAAPLVFFFQVPPIRVELSPPGDA